MNTSILDVLLGMVFLFVVISLICSAIQELIAQIFRLRAKNLEAGLANLLKMEKGKEDGFVTELFNHPLINSLSKEGQKPSYIPPNHFALALLDIMTGSKGKLEPKPAGLLKEFENKFANTDAGKSITLLISEAGDDVTKAREAVEKWFNASMDRVQGWYKRMATNIIFIVALIVCVTLNIDSIKIAERLWEDKELSAKIGEVAIAYSKSRNSESTDSSNEKSSENPITFLEITPYVDPIKDYPIGWQHKNGKWIWEKGDGKKDEKFTNMDWLLKFMGILVTIVAASFGAPFWFQLLNKVANLRASGSSPSASDDKKDSPKET